MRLDRRALLMLFVIGGFAAQAQVSAPSDPDWKEVEAPPPPQVRTTGLIPLEVPGTTLHYGVDPGSVTLDADGVVRYVMVASSDSGAVNALYEGIRCDAGEFKVYARYNTGSGWRAVKEASWQPLGNQSASRHSLVIARTGACIGQAPNRSASQIVRDLKAPVNRRFRIE